MTFTFITDFKFADCSLAGGSRCDVVKASLLMRIKVVPNWTAGTVEIFLRKCQRLVAVNARVSGLDGAAR